MKWQVSLLVAQERLAACTARLTARVCVCEVMMQGEWSGLSQL